MTYDELYVLVSDNKFVRQTMHVGIHYRFALKVACQSVKVLTKNKGVFESMHNFDLQTDK